MVYFGVSGGFMDSSEVYRPFLVIIHLHTDIDLLYTYIRRSYFLFHAYRSPTQ